MNERATKKNQRFVRIIECEFTSALFQKCLQKKKSQREKN